MTATRILAAAFCLLVAGLPAQDKDASPLKAPGHVFIHPERTMPIYGTGPWLTSPVLVDVAFQAAFQKLRAAQQELAMADTPAKARNALDKIEKALMEIRRALWKAEREGRSLQPRPLPIFGGMRIELQTEEPQVIIPTVIR